MTQSLLQGYEVVQDSDGDWVLIPPEDVTIFSVPGEPLLLAAVTEGEAVAEASGFLASVERDGLYKALFPLS